MVGGMARGGMLFKYELACFALVLCPDLGSNLRLEDHIRAGLPESNFPLVSIVAEIGVSSDKAESFPRNEKVDRLQYFSVS